MPKVNDETLRERYQKGSAKKPGCDLRSHFVSDSFEGISASV